MLLDQHSLNSTFAVTSLIATNAINTHLAAYLNHAQLRVRTACVSGRKRTPTLIIVRIRNKGIAFRLREKTRGSIRTFAPPAYAGGSDPIQTKKLDFLQ
ncbi:MAG TPA: hypothetical protein PLP21_06330 [Pyrinomonadaceae bacterium]|nr:hypothetical protein [Acidobacteriota bacterium]HQZ95917.1 hypothetical protein [Pyrinomonadaceae bacterium]